MSVQREGTLKSSVDSADDCALNSCTWSRIVLKEVIIEESLHPAAEN